MAVARYQVTFIYSGKRFFLFYFLKEKNCGEPLQCNLSKKRLRHRCVPVDFTNKMKTFSIEHLLATAFLNCSSVQEVLNDLFYSFINSERLLWFVNFRSIPIKLYRRIPFHLNIHTMLRSVRTHKHFTEDSKQIKSFCMQNSYFMRHLDWSPRKDQENKNDGLKNLNGCSEL